MTTQWVAVPGWTTAHRLAAQPDGRWQAACGKASVVAASPAPDGMRRCMRCTPRSATGVPQRVLDMHAEYTAGATLTEIGVRYGLSKTSVAERFHRHGLPVRSNAEAHTGRRRGQSKPKLLASPEPVSQVDDDWSDWVAVERAVRGIPVGRPLTDAEVREATAILARRGASEWEISRKTGRRVTRVKKLLEEVAA